VPDLEPIQRICHEAQARRNFSYLTGPSDGQSNTGFGSRFPEDDERLCRQERPQEGGGGAQAATLNNLAVQQSRLENDIQTGIQTGKLTTTEATELTNDLNAIKQSATQAMADGTLNDPEVVSMVRAMEALGTKIQNYTNNTSTTTPGSATVPASTPVPTPAATTTTTPVSTPAATSVAPGTPPVPITGNVLYQRIANGLAAGRINRTQANDLFKMENRIHDLES